MANIFKAFVKKHEAGGGAVFIKTLAFYLDSLKGFDYKKILEALDEEIQALKRDMKETTKISLERVKDIYDVKSM